MANINIRIDDDLKRQAEFVLNDLGLNMTTATTIFLKQVVRIGGIPFELRADPYTAYVRRALDEADEHARAGQRVYSEEEFRGKVETLFNELQA